jgi:glutamate/tyrosine decarboxylase-like PLP-dependent enzyme
MNRSAFPSSAFIDPRGKNRDEIEHVIQQVMFLLLPYLTEAAERSPLPNTDLPEVGIPETTLEMDQLLNNLRSVIEASMNPAHPGYIGHMNSIPTTMSILGDLVASALSNNMLFHETSPSFTPMELLLMKQFARIFGLGDSAGGVLLGAGTMANLQVLAVARNVKIGSIEKGVTSLRRPSVLFASEAAHASVKKASMILGLGTSAVIPVATNDNSQMDPHSLEAEIRKAKSAGQQPFCVVATAGTTVTGNIDPLPDIRTIAQEHGMWFHVDAAYGGALIFSEKHKQKLAGIEEADSITFNPQKWLHVSNGSSMALFRRFEEMEKAFRIPSPYAGGHSVTNLGEITVHGSRRVEVLKLWLTLQHLGMSGIRQLVDEAYALTDYFLARVRERPFLQVVGEPDMNIVCFRGAPNWLSQNEWDDWTIRLQAHLLRKHDVFLSSPPYRGARWLRAVIMNPFTDQSLVDQLFANIDSFAHSAN